MLSIMKAKVLSVFKDQKGQGMVEYALLVGLIAIVVMVVLALLGPAISKKFQDIITAIG